ncbi:NAD(P)-dependent dehydrogenase (short-subunit alcohol dehydrogenase family) [Halarchaeum rubridurum]|uniref:NAD(P)-dependent dehydrogenase (Short-subunit alcohol dehydrogenase family) n=2 Tax=Halarchaeum TaxID=744724 RepID=A0A830G4Z1_9EURY|nr:MULTISPECIES: SDR family oxidoreductase [Halarchaeum]MBP1955949.1 NAD(P)-dependent dehydrogenase (short-subunit alcohol dehydrogenase family) [Halarchaeum rubridurum]GGM75869.1 short chain dehydrogenase [Halarchaeum rubridurum]
MVANNSVALVTGGGSGIGRETALEFAAEGARVVVADVDVKGGEGTIADIEADGGDALFVETDVTDAAETEAMVEAAVEEYGSLDYAFNNAGIGGDSATVEEYDAESWESVIDVNLVGVFKCMQAEIAQMKQQDAGGVVVNNSSILGQVGFATSSGYVAAKHGVLGLTKTAALENGETGVRVNAVCPGFIDTPLLREGGMEEGSELREQIANKHAMNRLGTPEEVASAVLWLCDDDASFVTGEALGVDGGYLAQ